MGGIIGQQRLREVVRRGVEPKLVTVPHPESWANCDVEFITDPHQVLGDDRARGLLIDA
ncbi:MAG: hypothetical protein QG671_3250, partial [Actinomycetota bacterium]|nr:hypothetical protein [Actinomycetota bacterium]